MTYDVGVPFRMLIYYLNIFFSEMSVKILWFLNWVAFFLIAEFYEFFAHFGYVFCKYFSQSMTCLLILLISSSAERKFLILKEFSPINYFLHGLFLWCCLKSHHRTQRKSTLNIHWKDWYWSLSSNTLATLCELLTHWKRPWLWEGLGPEEKGTTEDEMARWHHWLDGHKFR